MANKRMFSLSVVDTDKFLEMPLSSRLLYYELGMRADDDGFVGNWKKILLFTGLKEDDMKVSRAFSELNQGKPKDIEKRKNIIKSSGYFSVPLKDEKVAISTSGTADGEKRFFQESIRRKTKKFSSTDQMLRGWDLPYFCPKFQPLMQKITYLSGLPNCLTNLQTCLILCMLFLIVSVCIMIRKRKLPKSVHSPKMKVCYSLRLAE